MVEMDNANGCNYFDRNGDNNNNMTFEFQNTSQNLTYSNVSCSGDNLIIKSTIITDNFDMNDEVYDELWDLINNDNDNLNILNLTIFYHRSFENVFDDFNLTFSNGINLDSELSSDDCFGDDKFCRKCYTKHLLLDTNDDSDSSRRGRNLNLEERRQLASARYYVKGEKQTMILKDGVYSGI